MQGAAEFHHQVTDALLPQAHPVLHDATALDATVDMLDPEPTLVQGLVSQWLLQRQLRAHRDNLSPATPHRRFALSLNLHAGYEGGDLRFPEDGPHLYRPAAGGALVFACSHLHEVTEVRQGRRFGLLSFLFSEGESRPVRARSTASASPPPPSSR
jgi:hypothetical protein